MKIKFLISLIFIFILFSCDKQSDYINSGKNNSSSSVIFPYISYSVNGNNNLITAYADSANQRLSIGYGSGSIIGTDTCFVHYSCSFLHIFDSSQTEIKIEFYKIELKPNLKEYNNSYYYPSIIELGNRLLTTGYKNVLEENDSKYYPGIKITYIDENGNYFYSTDTLQTESYFVVTKSEKTRTVEYETCQEVNGSFDVELRNTQGDSLINFTAEFKAIYINPF